MYDPKDPRNFDIQHKVNKYEENYLMAKELRVGDKLRMKESNSPYWRAGQVGVVAYKDNDNDFWVDFGEVPHLYPPVENWGDLNGTTWCIGQDRDELPTKYEEITI